MSVSPRYEKHDSVTVSSDMQDEMSRGISMSSAKLEGCGISEKNPYNKSVKLSEGYLGGDKEHNVVNKLSLRPKHIPQSSSNSTLRLREYFQTLSKSIPGGKVVRGTITPTKRKLIENKKVALLVPVFDSENTPVISPTESESVMASPAKRQKMETGVKHPSSQPPKSA